MRSFLQTQGWLNFQKEVGHKVWRFDDGKITANIIKLGLPLGKSLLYIPHGPEIDFAALSGERASLAHSNGRAADGEPRPNGREHFSGLKNELANFVKYLKDLAREEKAIFVKLEPLSDVVMELLYRRGVKRSSKQIQPYRTVVVDLNLPEDHLLGRMHQKTRYNINLSEKKGLKLEKSNNIETFWKLLKQTAKKDQFSTHPKEYYEKMLAFFRDEKELKTKLFLVKYEGKYIGGAIIMLDGETAYYLHGAMDRDYKNLMAPYFMHWEIIKNLKVPGFKYYDFWGIDPRRWPGVTRFKLGWGGELKEYPGSFDLPVSKIWYLSYNLARKIF